MEYANALGRAGRPPGKFVFLKHNKLNDLIYVQKMVLKTLCSIPIGSFKRSILVAANPRGGSTWVAEILNQLPNAFMYYEPLNLGYNPELVKMGIVRRTHIPEEAQWPEMKSFFAKLLSGKLYHHYMTFHPNSPENSLYNLVFAKYRIYKFCRINLMLPWVCNNFDLSIKPIVVFRHPCAVVASQIKFGQSQGGDWNMIKGPTDLLNQRFNQYILEHKSLINSVKSQVQSLATLWCLTNKYLLTHPDNNRKWQTFAYEDLLLNPKLNISRLSQNIGFDKEKINMKVLSSPSKSSIEAKDLQPEAQIETWRKSLTSSEIEEIMSVVTAFGLNKFYDKDPWPSLNMLYNERG